MLDGFALVGVDCVAIFSLSPPLSPQPSLAPPGERGRSTALFGLGFEGGEFTVAGQHSKWPLTALCGRVFEGLEFTVLCQPSK